MGSKIFNGKNMDKNKIETSAKLKKSRKELKASILYKPKGIQMAWNETTKEEEIILDRIELVYIFSICFWLTILYKFMFLGG